MMEAEVSDRSREKARKSERKRKEVFEASMLLALKMEKGSMIPVTADL